jgi:hypothetical protein
MRRSSPRTPRCSLPPSPARRSPTWFGHYLKDELAAAWIASGVSYLQREQELKALKAKKAR